MNIKKTCIYAALPLLSLMAVSCGVEEGENRQTLSAKMLQLVIPDDDTKAVTFQEDCLYQLSMDLNAGTLTMLASGIEADGAKGDFRSDAIPFVAGYNGVSQSYFLTKSGNGMLGQSVAVTDITGYLITYRPTWINGGMNNVNSLVMSYRIPGAKVVTMQPSPRFFGTTTTHYPSATGTQTSTTGDASYGIVFDDDMKHATVTIYSVQFAPGAPKLESVVLKDLDVALRQHGYTITGTDIIPQVPEGGASGTMVEYRNFPFKSFTFRSAGEYLTEAECSYEVNATIGERQMLFDATFSGKASDYVVLSTNGTGD
ncbi:MAG: hypothetical protein K2O78_00715 [Muribaculaceae bacterium]|nr:hypothetical protein [Muribaculaceae bacterium]MDE7080163.1 hypothetical protein [Muribaculaceae bacterium]